MPKAGKHSQRLIAMIAVRLTGTRSHCLPATSIDQLQTQQRLCAIKPSCDIDEHVIITTLPEAELHRLQQQHMVSELAAPLRSLAAMQSFTSLGRVCSNSGCTITALDLLLCNPVQLPTVVTASTSAMLDISARPGDDTESSQAQITVSHQCS